jgi:hypothetical protein
VSHDFLGEHVAGELRRIWLGSKKFVAASEIEAWLERVRS